MSSEGRRLIMKRYLKMTGFVTLILAIYFISSIIVGAVVGFYFVFVKMLQEGTQISTEELTAATEGFILQNTVQITAAAAVLSLLFFWIVFLIRRESLLKYCQAGKTSLKHLFCALFMGVGFYFFLRGILVITDLPSLFPRHQELMELIFLEPSFIITLVAIGLIVPVVEEIMLRGIILNRLREELPLTAALLLQALIFGLIHMNVLQGGYAFVGGILMGVVYVWTKSLWAPIALHAGWNSASVILVQTVQVEFSLPVTLATMAAGAAVVIAGLLYFKQQRIPPVYDRNKLEPSP